MGNIIKDNDFISAKQARECSAAYRKTVVDNEIKKVKAVIKEATEHGKDIAYLDGTISIETKRILENLGYRVTFGSQYNEEYVTIDWRKVYG